MTASEASLLRTAVVDLTTAVKGLESKVEAIYVRKDVLDPQVASMKEDIKELQEWLKWILRIVLAIVVAAVLGLVVNATGVGK